EYRKSVTEAGDWAATEWTGQGAIFCDVLGREYIDCLGGYGLLDLGWSHPDVVDNVRAQLMRTPMPSQELIDPLRGVLARLVANITPGDIKYSFFTASGTEAVEGAIKLAKLYTKKSGFIVAVKAFHGKTMGSLSMMGKSDFRQPAGTLYGGPIYHVPYGDADAVERQLEICEKVGIDIAACLFEPIQGEAGAIVPPDDFWPRIREATKHYGVLLIADEVQTGMGRTGKLWGVDHWNVVPDIMALGKSFGGGVMPVSSFCSTEEIWQVMMDPNPFIHTTTTGGGALACSAAIAAIQVTLRERLWEVAAAKGEYLIPKLEALAEKYPQIFTGITGRGLLIGMHFKDCEVGYKVAAGLFKRGVLVAGTLTSAHTVRIEPPLVITYEQIDAVLNRLSDVLSEIAVTL
ncbi:MAG: aminotransferase class III-fold pyridoxal phosphate-dependent enzyme, partial [Chloroflexi bacterium]